MPPRLIGLYALARMERDGALYGYRLAQQIADRTGGRWRPGPGAIYPSLARLVERGFARSAGAGRRREYRITPAGRAALRRIRRRDGPAGGGGPDLSTLWAEIAGEDDPGRFLLRRLERTTDAVERYVRSRPADRRADAVARRASALLARSAQRLARSDRARPRSPARR